MATKTKAKKAVKSSAKTKLSHETRTDGKIIKSIPVDVKERDKMLSVLTESTNEDVSFLANHWESCNKKEKENLSEHYEINGTEYITSIFRGNREHALLCCPEGDKALLSK